MSAKDSVKPPRPPTDKEQAEAKKANAKAESLYAIDGRQTRNTRQHATEIKSLYGENGQYKGFTDPDHYDLENHSEFMKEINKTTPSMFSSTKKNKKTSGGKKTRRKSTKSRKSIKSRKSTKSRKPRKSTNTRKRRR